MKIVTKIKIDLYIGIFISVLYIAFISMLISYANYDNSFNNIVLNFIGKYSMYLFPMITLIEIDKIKNYLNPFYLLFVNIIVYTFVIFTILFPRINYFKNYKPFNFTFYSLLFSLVSFLFLFIFIYFCNNLISSMTNWKPITTSEDISSILDASESMPQIIFKDSVTCGISAYAKERLEKGSDLLTEKADFNYLDLLAYRSVSNFIAEELNVVHQSPQIIVLKDRKVIYQVTHHSIEVDKILIHL